MSSRPVPFDRDAEESVLGACMLGPKLLDTVTGVLRPDQFFFPEHGEAYRAVLSLRDAGSVVDEITLADALERRGKLDEPPKPLVIRLVHTTPGTETGAAQHAAIVADLAARRRVLAISEEVARVGSNGRPLTDLSETIEELRTLVRPSPREKAAPVMDGASFVLDAPVEVSSIWGDGEHVLMAEGEALFLVGPSGVGKTTVAHQLALARIGLRSEVLGFPVQPDERRVLVVAADRPNQAARSLRRMVGEQDREHLTDRLRVWRGPTDLVARPTTLLDLADDYGAGTVIVDSLKDVALDLSTDETGNRVNSAIQTALAAGVQVVVLHHQRKQKQDGARPKSLADVYGSVWLTAGAGSVVLLWGEPGDLVVHLFHLKQPVADVGPLRVQHDHDAGRSYVVDRVDLLAIARASRVGLTAQDAARSLYECDRPGRNQVEKARRYLGGLVRRGLLHRKDGRAGGRQGGKPTRWYAVETVHGGVHAPVEPETDHPDPEPYTDADEWAGESVHGTVHGDHDARRSRSTPSLEGEREPDHPAVALLKRELGAEVVEERER